MYIETHVDFVCCYIQHVQRVDSALACSAHTLLPTVTACKGTRTRLQGLKKSNYVSIRVCEAFVVLLERDYCTNFAEYRVQDLAY